jgi:hypothetical protein
MGREETDGWVKDIFWQMLLLFFEKKEKWLKLSATSVLALC